MTNTVPETVWDYIRSIYNEKYGIPYHVVDMIAIEPILKQVVKGYCVDRIVRAIQLPKKYIKNVINDHFGFYGWDSDLDFSPIAFYRRSGGHDERFEQEINMISTMDTTRTKFLFEICKEYEEIKKEVDRYHGES